MGAPGIEPGQIPRLQRGALPTELNPHINNKIEPGYVKFSYEKEKWPAKDSNLSLPKKTRMYRSGTTCLVRFSLESRSGLPDKPYASYPSKVLLNSFIGLTVWSDWPYKEGSTL